MENLNEMQEKIHEILIQYPEGLGEYELIKLCQQKKIIPMHSFFDSAGLFETHFILFHLLYCLRIELFQQQKGCLEISPLMIIISPYHRGKQGLLVYDELANYYLDGRNLEKMTAQKITQMLADFYNRVDSSNRRNKALNTLGIMDGNTDFKDITTKYRKLVMQHHPDRGGDKKRLQEINSAFQVLKKCYSV